MSRTPPKLHHSLPGAAPARGWRTWLALAFLLVLVVFVIGIFSAYHADIPAAELEARYATGASELTEILGSRVHFRDEPAPEDPDAPTLLLLHGTAASLHTWDGWAEALGEQYRLLRLDLQGYGLTGPNADHDYSIERQIAVIDALVEARGIDRMAVAGNSLGGLIAWRYALAHPEKVSHLLLIDPAGAPRPAGAEASESGTGFRMIDLARIPVLRGLLTKLTPRFVIRRSMEQVYGDPSKVSPDLVTRYHELLLREGNRGALVKSQVARAEGRVDPSPELTDVSRISQPTLIVWGDLDRWIPPSHAELFHQAIEDSELRIYEGVGHVPMEEIPRRTAEDAAEFLERRGFGAPEPSLVAPALEGIPSTASSGASGTSGVSAPAPTRPDPTGSDRTPSRAGS